MAEDLQPIKQVIQIDVKESGVDEATSSVGKLNTTISDTSTENKKSEESFKSMKTQLREANAELQKAVQIYGETSEQAIKAAKGVANLKDQIGFAKDLSETFNPDQKFKALGSATQLAGTGLQGVTAGMALFGGESEDTQKQLLKVQAAMAFSDAISNLSNVADQWNVLRAAITSSSLAQKANMAATGAAAIVQNIFTGSVSTTTAGFKALKFAIAATGIGLLVVGLVAVYQNFDKISKFMTNLIPGLSGISEGIMSIVQSVTDFVGITSEADRALDRLKENADASLALNKKYLAEHGSQLDEFTKQKIAAKDKYSEAIKQDGANQKALAEELNRELAKIEYSRGDESRKIAKENADKAKKDKDAAREKAATEAEKEKQRLLDEQKRIDDERLAAEMQSAKDALAIIDELKKNEETPAQKEQREYEEKKAVLEANNLSTEELTRQHLINIADIEQEAREKKAADDKEADEKAADEKKKIDEAILEQKKSVQDAQMDLADSAVGFLSKIAGKNKTLQKAAIIAESALGIGKSIISTNASNVAATAEGAALAIPTAGASVAAASSLVAMNYVSLGLGVAGNIAATTKALQALGGGSAPSGGAAGGAATPSRNVAQVGFQGSSENQISTAITQQQKEQPPIQAFVVSQAVTDSQELDRKKQLQNSF